MLKRRAAADLFTEAFRFDEFFVFKEPKSLKLKSAATIATALVIVAGLAMISPLFLRQQNKSQEVQKIMLSFSVLPSAEVSEWCQNVAAILDSSDIGASIFFAGEAAERHPESVLYFSHKVDIGSQAYNNIDITGFSDYSMKLQEVQEG